jgi:phosphomannomutase
MFHPHIIRAYDIRGTVGVNLFEKDASFLGQQFGSYLRQKNASTIAVGYDGRTSSPVLAQALCHSLVQQGLTVIHIGMVPTPLVYFAVQTCPCDAGIAVTGSHNPAQDNGFKITLRERPFYGEDLQNLAILNALEHSVPGRIVSVEIEDSYFQSLKQVIPSPLPFKIVWDTGHGIVGKLIHDLANLVCTQSIFLYSKVDGTFPAHVPNPSEACAMRDLQEAVRQNHFDLGVGFDGDGDRLGVVDATGRLLSGDQLLAIFAEDVLQHHPKARILADVKTSRGVLDRIQQLGGEPQLCPSGHSVVKDWMKKAGAIFSGELSGHFFFADEYFGFDDAMYGVTRLLRFLNRSQKPLHESINKIPLFCNTPEYRFPCPEHLKTQLISNLKNSVQKESVPMHTFDGVRVELPEGWWLARASNTEAVITLRFEANQSDQIAGVMGHFLRHFWATALGLHEPF